MTQFPPDAKIHPSDQIELINNYVFLRSLKNGSRIWKYNDKGSLEQICELPGNWTHLHAGKYLRVEKDLFPPFVEVIDFTDTANRAAQNRTNCSII